MNKLWIGVMIVVMGCGDSGDTVKDFIPGTYVRFAAGDYSKTWDTLRIESYDPSQGTYVIEQRTGFQRTLDGKLQPREYMRRKHIAVLDEQTHQLQDRKTGKYYTFSPERETVLSGSAEYIKINDAYEKISVIGCVDLVGVDKLTRATAGDRDHQAGLRQGYQGGRPDGAALAE